MLLKELYSTEDVDFEQMLSTILPIFREQGENEASKKACELYGKDETTQIIATIKRIIKNKGLSDVEKNYNSKGLTPPPEVVTW